MQGGDPNGNGTGGSENTIAGEFTANGYDNTLSHTRVAVSMARSNSYNSASIKQPVICPLCILSGIDNRLFFIFYLSQIIFSHHSGFKNLVRSPI